jgi:hypothetical protein
LTLDFLTGALDPRITFTRTTTATFVGSDGLIQTAAIDAPRFDYDPVTLSPRGLLIEDQKVNLSLQSEAFDTASWGKTLCTVTANVIASPTGAVNADLVTDNSAAGTELSQAVTVTSGATVAHSRYFKYGSAQWVRLVLGDATNFVRGWFDIQNGAVGATAVGGTGGNASVVITNAGNGWYRCTLIGSLTGITSYGCISMTALANSNTARVLGGTYYVWGSQTENGVSASSYIPTAASQVTRAADVALVTGTNFSSWYNATEGSMLAVFSVPSNDVVNTVYSVSNGTTAQRWQVTVIISFIHNMVATTTQANISVGTHTPNTIFKSAFGVKLNSVQAAVNGVLGTEDTTAVLPTVNRLNIGSNATSGGQLNGYVRSLTYYPTRLTNAELQALTV